MTRLRPILLATLVLSAACGGDEPAPPASSNSVPSSSAGYLAMPDANALYGAPQPNTEDLQELFDIARDLQAVSAGTSGAAQDLRDDLARFVPQGTAPSAVEAMVADVSQALSGHSLSQASAERLSVMLYAALHAGRLEAAERDRLTADLRQALVDAGATEATAGTAAGHVSTLAQS